MILQIFLDDKSSLKLRDHPLLKYRGAQNWPPVWTRGTKGMVNTVKGEVGVLKEVYYDAGRSNKCFLVIDYQLQSYMGCITCSTRSFCTQLTHFLRGHIGHSIEDIGHLRRVASGARNTTAWLGLDALHALLNHRCFAF
jgi:hypothetical protein